MRIVFLRFDIFSPFRNPSMLRQFQKCFCVKPSNLVRVDGYKQHVFRWGIGNKFRSLNANRYTPVHHPRPKEVTVRFDYFQSPDNSAIQYDSLNEQWEVFWYEYNKLNAKPFPVKKFGIEESKAEAMKFLNELKESGRYEAKPEFKSNVDGVFWDHRTQSWICNGSDKGIRAFSAIKHGMAGAQKLAEGCASESTTMKLRREIDDLLTRY